MLKQINVSRGELLPRVERYYLLGEVPVFHKMEKVPKKSIEIDGWLVDRDLTKSNRIYHKHHDGYYMLVDGRCWHCADEPPAGVLFVGKTQRIAAAR